MTWFHRQGLHKDRIRNQFNWDI